MRFGPLPLTEAEGAILAHSVDAGGVVLKKARYWTPERAGGFGGDGAGERDLRAAGCGGCGRG